MDRAQSGLSALPPIDHHLPGWPPRPPWSMVAEFPSLWRGLPMSHRFAFGAFAVAVLAVAGVAADESLKSGPQIGDMVVEPFDPLNVNGSKAGEKHCLV